MKNIHFDNATASPPTKKSLEVLRKASEENWFSPFSPYSSKEIELLNQAKQKLHVLFPAPETGSLFFAPSRQVAIDSLFRFIFNEMARTQGKNHFLTSQVDESPSIFSLAALEELGGKGTLLKVNQHGQVTPDILREALTPRSVLVSLSLGSGLLGTIHPLKELLPILKEREVLLHLDLSHVMGKIEISPEILEADFLTFSGETFHAPRGAAILWAKRPLRSQTFVWGSEMKALGLMDLARCMALSEAAVEAAVNISTIQLEGSRLRDLLEEGIKATTPQAEIFFREVVRLPTTSFIAFPGITSESLLFYLHEKGLQATFGGGIFQETSNLMKACRLPRELTYSALSFTLSRMNTFEEVEKAVQIISESYLHLRRISP